MEHLVDGGNSNRIAFGRNAARVSDLDFSTAFMELAHNHGNALQHVHCLEAGDNARDAVLLCQELIGLHTNDGAYMTRQNERINLQ